MASTRSSTADSDLIASLHALSAKSPKLVRSSTYAAPADPSIEVRSWKMNEFKYYDIPSPFPTLARGLFTKEIQKEGEAKQYQMVVRGYDKFFNIGEVPWTTWASLETHTAPPYILSLKSNGCIIFIAALTPTKLIITSKHSVGPVAAASLSHAQAGEMWLRKYLEKKGKTEEDLAARLWEDNVTAIAELCDDAFEEHVLGYPPEKTGLHLHGLNVRSKDFNTLPTEAVDAFADAWGFIKTPTVVFNSIKEVKEFTDGCAETGEWNGEAVEGFVVRTHVTEPPTSNKGKGTATDSSPYAPGSSFFFKVKFDEPYMMYRDWREVTKMLLSAKGPMTLSILPKSKMKRAETKLYVKWVIEEIKKNPGEFKDYTKGKGIIAVREKFLEWMKSEKGEKELKAVEVDEKPVAGKFGKTIIVPVAIPGCGKTAVSVALAHIFGFGHTQSDDVHIKKPAPVFVRNVLDLLENHDVVIADKNNHLKLHRESLREAVKRYSPPVRLLALNWSLDKPNATIHRICTDRVQLRGDNHQTLRADSSIAKSHEEVIWMFLNSTQELTASEVDATVEMELGEDLDKAVWRAVNGVVKELGLELPSQEKVDEALEIVKGYKPTTKKPDDKKEKGKKAEVRYYGLLPEVDLVALLDGTLAEGEGVDDQTKAFWAAMKRNGQVAKRPHVTLVHKNNKDAEKELWDRCAALHQMAGTPPLFKAKLGSVVWNDRVMALTVEELSLESAGGEGQEGSEFVCKLPADIRGRLHITVGTKASNIQGVEALKMVQDWRQGKAGDKTKSVKLEDVVVYGRVKGLMG
ncbi:RNA ligase-domain-containing protein [Crassisporium funariophilum]|nr:RNA ligase-domain-containing protein [Crassisporium funariophilum]